MNWITIIGIIIIAVGTFLTYYGTILNSKKDKEDITNKIDQFNKKVDDIKKENIPVEDKEKKIEQVENEFQQWANKFVSSQDEKRLELERSDINLKERKIKLNQEWRSLYKYFFESLTKMVEAYKSADPNSKVSFIENVPLPSDIYLSNRDKFRIVIRFGDKLYWLIWLRINEPINKSYIPLIEISTIDDLDKLKYIGPSNLRIMPYIETGIIIQTYDMFEKAGFDEKYDIKDYKKSIIEIIQKALEYQILMLNK